MDLSDLIVTLCFAHFGVLVGVIAFVMHVYRRDWRLAHVGMTGSAYALLSVVYPTRLLLGLATPEPVSLAVLLAVYALGDWGILGLLRERERRSVTFQEFVT